MITRLFSPTLAELSFDSSIVYSFTQLSAIPPLRNHSFSRCRSGWKSTRFHARVAGGRKACLGLWVSRNRFGSLINPNSGHRFAYLLVRFLLAARWLKRCIIAKAREVAREPCKFGVGFMVVPGIDQRHTINLSPPREPGVVG